MRSVEILRVEILAGVPLYRLTVDGETLLRRAPMRRVVEALAIRSDREKVNPSVGGADSKLGTSHAARASGCSPCTGEPPFQSSAPTASPEGTPRGRRSLTGATERELREDAE